MPNSSCVVFQDSWVKDPSFSPWLKRSGSKNNEAYCSLCKKTIDYKSMGRSAIVSHMKGKKHLSLASASSSSDKCSMLNFVTNSKGKLTTPTATEQSSPAPTFATPSMDLFVSDRSVLEAEIWWSVRTAIKNHSTSSNSDIDFYFKRMFPGVPIVQKFSCGYTKSSYLMSFGVVPHLKSTVDLGCNEVKGSEVKFRYNQGFVTDKVLYNMYN